MKRKPILPVLGAAALSLLLTAAAPAQAAAFPDTEGHPSEAAIDRFSALELVNGTSSGLFCPDQTISRAEMCVLLDHVFTFTDMAENSFADLGPRQWFTPSVLRANALGIILGDGVNVRPHDTIRWDEALVMTARAFGLEEDPDACPVPTWPWTQGHIGAMYAAGFVLDEELERLDAGFTRADAVTVLDRAVSVLGWNAIGKILFQDRLIPILEDVPTPAYDRDAFYRGEDGRLYYDDGVTPVAYGIDVSRYQNEIDWQEVAADGIDFAIIRLGFRGYGPAGTLNMDRYFEANYSGALEAGLDVGVYFFSQAVNVQEAEEEARYVLEHLDGRALTYPLIFDWENIYGATARTDNVDNETLHACAEAFNRIIAEAGYQPMAYFSTHQGYLKYDLSKLTDLPFWYAYYTEGTSPLIYYDFRMWQYTSSGKVAGIEGEVDMNICFYPFGAETM